MNAQVTISNIYWNRGLKSFFFRDQAYATLEELVNRSSMSGQETLDALDSATDDMDIDDVEESFYSDSVEELAEQFDIELDEDEEDEDDD